MSTSTPTTKDAIDQTVQAFVEGKGIKDTSAIERLKAALVPKLAPLVDKWAATDSDRREFARIVLRSAISAPDVGALNQHSWNDLRARHVSNRSVSDLIHATNEWLRDNHPETHAVLRHNGLGSHPRIVRRLTDAYLEQKAKTGKLSKSDYMRPRSPGTRTPAGTSPLRDGLLAGGVYPPNRGVK